MMEVKDDQTLNEVQTEGWSRPMQCLKAHISYSLYRELVQ